MAGRFICLLILLTAAAGRSATNDFVPVTPTGQTFIHDPSSIVEDKGVFHVFGTGPGIRSKTSTNLTSWSNDGSVFEAAPAWTVKSVPEFRGYFWAPDVVQVNGKFFLYYSVSSWGKQTSAIGLATNPTLDSAATNYLWTDAGEVIGSTNGSLYNTIDPSAFLDSDGRLWLAFGSYWEGIFLTELDPQTGKLIRTNAPLYQLAWNPSIEAACLTRHGRFYYLFVNWGQCCRGTNSTYEVRVGRAEKITGPYRDRDGNNLATGGGSPFLQSQGRFIGPGHIGILHDGETTRFSYHYYDADTHGRSRLAIGAIAWVDDWPVPANDAPQNWKLVWHDEFNTNGAPDPANWNYEHGFVRNNELQWYQPENAFCTNGLLVIEARREHKRNPNYVPGGKNWKTSREWIDYTSASLTSRRMQEFKYGRFEMRARIDTRLGSWPAFWTLGATPGIHWPACGEIDIMEYYTGTVLANLGWQLDGKTKWLAKKKPLGELGDESWSTQFHIWTMEWNDQRIDLLLDGRRMNHLNLADADSADEGNPFRRPVYIILNQAIGGDCGGDPSATPFPVRFEVDWVRVYQRAP
ncbi:MAG TPA: family 43 glycosylhydrolase [Candidatus Binatia bacterium]|nr:family 43 glycosylhydrolase [Candidatus Binatia bacterium]